MIIQKLHCWRIALTWVWREDSRRCNLGTLNRRFFGPWRRRCKQGGFTPRICADGQSNHGPLPSASFQARHAFFIVRAFSLSLGVRTPRAAALRLPQEQEQAEVAQLDPRNGLASASEGIFPRKQSMPLAIRGSKPLQEASSPMPTGWTRSSACGAPLCQ